MAQGQHGEQKSTPMLKRTEIVFLYDVMDANPNGDPNDENRPRWDPDTCRAKVSDVRLKRTIRDYWHDYLDEEIFCRQIEKEDGTIQDGKDRAEDFYKQVEKEAGAAKNVLAKRGLIQRRVLSDCIDVRVFGATIPVAATKKNEKDSSVTLTGPVQFAMGTSLNETQPRFIKGTGAFASGQGAQQKTFREEYVLPYALIAFYGIVNEQAAKTTEMTDEDADKLYEAIWYGTKNLITRSKIGQRPLLLLLVEYETPKAYVGRLDRYLRLDGPQECRDATDAKVNLMDLVAALSRRKSDITRIRYAYDARLALPTPPPQCFLEAVGDGSAVVNLEYK